MTEYFDIRCGDDLDPFARDVGPLETLAQDIFHWLKTSPMTLPIDSDWGFGLEDYLGRPLPSTLAADMQSGVRRDFEDRVSDAQCTITPIAGEIDAYHVELVVEVDGAFLTIAINMSPTGGIVRVS